MPWKSKRSSISRRQQKRAEAVKTTTDSRYGLGGYLLIGVVVLLGGVVVFFIARRGGHTDMPALSAEKTPIVAVVEKPSDKQREDWDRFEVDTMKVAREFLAEADPVERLKLVRDSDVVKEHFVDYAPQALSMDAKDLRKLAVKTLDGERMASFAVTLADASVRLLNVVEEGGRLLVDWDSYARYGSMTWDALLSEDSSEAEALVRVFVQPGDYYNPPFDDPQVWTSFRLVSPDVNRPLYAFAKADREMAVKMRGIVMQNQSFRQHMTLRIKRHAGPHDKLLFSVEELVAVGWVVK